MRSIDDDVLKNELLELISYKTSPYANLIRKLISVFIDEQPTIDSLKHGKWIYKGARGRFPVCECSVCGNAENADWAILGDNVNYCPHCGARMDEEEQENES